MTPAAIAIQSSIAPLAPDFDAWLVDIWGVMHNGARAFAAACAATRRFRAGGGVVVLISNAPRPFAAVTQHLDALGVPSQAYDTGITSGDVTRGLIAGWQGRAIMHIGPERDLGLFTGFDVRMSPAEAADGVVCSGLFDDTKETPADYAGLLERLLARRIPMICANPDLVVERGSQLVYCAGAIAAAYAAKGGAVIYAGKPYPPIYSQAFASIDTIAGRHIPKQRILAIGDGINTDLLGAHSAGIRSLFIASAVHLPTGLKEGALLQLFDARPFQPMAALAALAW